MRIIYTPPGISGVNWQDWARKANANLGDVFRRIFAEPIVPTKYALTSSDVSLATGFAEVVGVTIAGVGAKTLVAFSCAVELAQLSTGVQSVDLQMLRGTTVVWTQENVLSVPAGSGTFKTMVGLTLVDEPDEGEISYSAEMLSDGTAVASRRSLIVTELRQ